MKFKLLIIALLCLFLFTISPPTSVLACSGMGPPLVDWAFESADTAVIGEFVELDDIHLNGIFRVTSYLMGKPGSEYILLQLNNQAAIRKMLEARYYGGECTTVSGRFEMHKTTVIFLKEQFDRSYTWTGLYGALYTFDSPDAKLTIYYSTNSDSTASVSRETNLEELLNYITTKSGQSALPTLPDNPYPITTPLVVTTDTGKRYLLPIDGSDPLLMTNAQLKDFEYPIGCSTPPCEVVSPNGLDSGKLIPPGEQNNEVVVYNNSRNFPVFNGNALLFSATSDAVAVWNSLTLEIHRLFYPGIGADRSEPVKLVNSTILNLNTDKDLQIGVAAWSPDGRFLAYSDAEGLWLWDVFSIGTSARLVLQTANYIPYARYFSPLGRYLAVQEGDILYNIDLVTGTKLPDGLVSPNDRVLLAFDTAAKGEFSLSVQWLAPLQSPKISFQRIHKLEWIDDQEFIMARCFHGYADEEERFVDKDQCVVAKQYPYLVVLGGYIGTDFAYAHDSKYLAIVADSSTLIINEVKHDLTGLIDGAITSIRWLPSLFYYEN